MTRLQVQSACIWTGEYTSANHIKFALHTAGPKLARQHFVHAKINKLHTVAWLQFAARAIAEQIVQGNIPV